MAERALHALGTVPEWIPVDLGGPAFRCEAEVDAYREDVERRAAALGLMALRWPDPFPGDVELGDAGRDLREVDRPRRRVQPRRAAPGVRGRPRPVACATTS